jgi:hypothetical protein
MDEVCPQGNWRVTLRSPSAILVHRLVTAKSPRVSKPPKPAAESHPCFECGVNLAKKKFCGSACRQAAYRKRLQTPAMEQKRQARKVGRAAVTEENALRRHGDAGMEFDGRTNRVGCTSGAALFPSDKLRIMYPLERELEFVLPQVAAS